MPGDTVSQVAANLMMDVSSVLLRRGQIRMQVALNQISFEINVQLIILLFFLIFRNCAVCVRICVLPANKHCKDPCCHVRTKTV